MGINIREERTEKNVQRLEKKERGEAIQDDELEERKLEKRKWVKEDEEAKRGGGRGGKQF